MQPFDEDVGSSNEKRVFELNTIFDKKDPERKFMSNQVSTGKYSVLTFLPKNLYFQFSKLANFYFLFLVLLQIIPGIGQENGSVLTAIPLCVVVGISMIKDIIEDLGRHRQDSKENNQECEAALQGCRTISTVRSREIQVGCLVKVYNNHNFPCDLILIKSSLPKGIAYVETKNLDGETNLK